MGLVALLLLGALLAPAQIRQVIPFRERGVNPAWSSRGQILYERDGELYLARANGDDCMTCHNPALTPAASASAQWAPDGNRFLFSNHGLWWMLAASKKLTIALPGAHGAQDLRISRDGNQILWTEPRPMLASIRDNRMVDVHPLSIDPHLLLRAIDDFAADAKHVLLTASPADAPQEADIFLCPLQNAICTKLTARPREYSAHGRLSPSGKHLLSASTENGWQAGSPANDNADYWLSSLNTPGTQRMTWFNEVQNPHYLANGARVSDFCWSPDGRWIVATVYSAGKTSLVKIEFPEPM